MKTSITTFTVYFQSSLHPPLHYPLPYIYAAWTVGGTLKTL